MKTLTLSIILFPLMVHATLTNVMNNVSINGTNSTGTLLIPGGAIFTPVTMLIQNSAFQSNPTNFNAAYATYLQVSIDTSNFVTVATNTTATTNAASSSFAPDISAINATYRVLIVTTNAVTNTIYFQR
jgi:hypothetical protein